MNGMKKSTCNQLFRTVACLALCWSTARAYGQFEYVNNNAGVTFIPYGGSFTYSLAWTNGIYSYDGQLGTWVSSFYKPSGYISINALFPSTGSFTYTIPYVTSSDDGSYYVSLNGTGSSTVSTTTVYMHVTPAIVQEPTNTVAVSGQSTTLGLIAGPSGNTTYTWYNTATGYQVASGASFSAQTSMNGEWIYCKISNTYGYAQTTPVLLTVLTNAASAFSYVNNDAGVEIVPYGGTYTYSISWSNGTYSVNGTLGTWVNAFYKPSGSINLEAVFPSTSSFSYTVPFVTSSDDGAYYLNLNSGSSSLNSSSVYMHVAPGIIEQPVATTVTNGTSTTMGLVAGPSNASFTWFDSATSDSIASGASFIASSSMNGKRIYCRISNSYGYTETPPVLIQIGSTAPSITSQPGNLTVALGQPATFSVAAIGTPPLGYSWFHNGYQVAGAEENFITIEAATNTDAGLYSCMVSNGEGTVTSASAMLSFATYPAITAQPQSLTVTQGQRAVFSAQASGAPISYSWLANGTPIPGATNSSLVISNANAADMAAYTFVASNGLGSVSSMGAVLTVFSLPLILAQPAGTSVGLGSNFMVSVSALGYPAIAYQWWLNNSVVAGATNPVYAVASAQNSNAGNYTVILTNSSGSVTSTMADVTVETYLPVITAEPTNEDDVLGSPSGLAVAATGSQLDYQWYMHSTNLAAAQALVLDGFVLEVTVTNGGGGYDVVPNVQILGGGGSGATATAVVSKGLVVAIDITDTGSDYTSAPMIQIDPPATGLTNQTGATLNLPAVGTNDAGTYFVVVTNGAGAVTSSNATLTVNVPVYIVLQPTSQTVNAGGTANFSVSVAGDAPYGYQWYEISTNQATATALVLNGFVYAANVTGGGSGYVTVPNVELVGGGGSGALAVAVVSNGVVTEVIVTNTGLGYTGIPVIQIDPPTGVAVAGQTSAICSLAGVTTNNAGDYYVIASNNYGSVTSLLASLTIKNATSNVVQNSGGPAMALTAGKAGMSLAFSVATNSSWTLWCAANLTPPVVWQPVCTNSADATGNWRFTDTNLDWSQKYYRVVQAAPGF